jgi:hypothetical protein
VTKGSGGKAGYGPAAADAKFREALAALVPAMQSTWASVHRAEPIDLRSREVTYAMLLRIAAFYRAQEAVKVLLEKRFMGASADFLVETSSFGCEPCLVHMARSSRPRASARSKRSVALCGHFRRMVGHYEEPEIRLDQAVSEGGANRALREPV